MKISLSIADLPFNIDIEDLFSMAVTLGFDGVEVLPGFKMSTILQLSDLSKKYNIPILSIHHPFWVGKYIISSEQAFAMAKFFNAVIVVHPLKNQSLSSIKQNDFMDQIVKLSKKTKVTVAVENMPIQSVLPIYKYFSKVHESTTQLLPLYEMCKDYGFGLTLDTSHFMTQDILSVEGFDKILPLIKNIHLSDCTKSKQHLALGDGYIDLEKLLKHLKKVNYSGLLTLELSPRLYSNKEKYYRDIEKSFFLIRSCLGIK